MNKEEREIQALRLEFEYRRHPEQLNPQILQNVFKETELKPSPILNWVWIWKSGLAFASLVLVVIVLFQITPPEPGTGVKGSFQTQQTLTVFEPEMVAQTLKKELAKLSIVSTLQVSEDNWVLEVENLSTGDVDGLFGLIQQFKLELPPPGAKSLQVTIVKKTNTNNGEK